MASASQIYHEAIKALAHEAIGHGTLASPDGRAFLDNPLCGDCVEMQVALSADSITALAHEVKGCLLCRASASIIGKRAVGMRLEDIERIGLTVAALLEQQTPPPSGWEELAVFAPVHGHPSRYGCVKLPFQALLAALRAAAGPRDA
jgi:nitrogen fixation protein NifU and related proteins